MPAKRRVGAGGGGGPLPGTRCDATRFPHSKGATRHSRGGFDDPQKIRFRGEAPRRPPPPPGAPRPHTSGARQPREIVETPPHPPRGAPQQRAVHAVHTLGESARDAAAPTVTGWGERGRRGGGGVRLTPSRPARRRRSGQGVGTRQRVTGTKSAVVRGPRPLPSAPAPPARLARDVREGPPRDAVAARAAAPRDLPGQPARLLVALDLPRAVRALPRRGGDRQRPPAPRALRRAVVRARARVVPGDGVRGDAPDGGGVPRPRGAAAHRGPGLDDLAAHPLLVRHDQLRARRCPRRRRRRGRTGSAPTTRGATSSPG